MEGRQKLTREELLAKRRISQKVRRDKIKLNPETYAQYKEKERQRYHRRKKEKKVKQINDMTPKQKRNQRKKWKVNSRNFRNRQRSKLDMIQTPAESTSDRDNGDTDGSPVYTTVKQPETSPSVSNGRYDIVGFNVTVTVVPEASNHCDSSDSDVLSTIK